jgi:hypothetical protein
VVIVGGAVFGARAANVSNQIDRIYSGNPDNVTLDEARDLDARGRSAERNQIILMSVGSALVVTGVALLVVGAMKAKKGKSKPAAAPEQPTARLIPALGPGNAGFVLQGRF